MIFAFSCSVAEVLTISFEMSELPYPEVQFPRDHILYFDVQILG